MSICKAKNCTSEQSINQDLTFHKFPIADSQLLQRWLTNIASPNFKPVPDHMICSLHFTDDQFLDTVPRRLSRYAVPTLLFIDNKYIPVIDDNAEITANENDEVKDEDDTLSEQSSHSISEDVSSTIISDEDSDSDFAVGASKRKTRSTTKNKIKVKKSSFLSKSNGKQKRKVALYNPRFVGDFKETDLKSPEKMRRLWQLSQNQIEDQKRKLRTYQQKNRRLESQVTRLKNIVKHLKTVHR